jgi:pimeloyl-ACP methyl ester carboxylesterase
VELYPNAGHFIMLDDPEIFIKKLKSFLEEETRPS